MPQEKITTPEKTPETKPIKTAEKSLKENKKAAEKVKKTTKKKEEKTSNIRPIGTTTVGDDTISIMGVGPTWTDGETRVTLGYARTQERTSPERKGVEVRDGAGITVQTTPEAL